jgi:hypothetical protein
MKIYKVLFLVILINAFTSCAMYERTKYKPYNNNGGFSDIFTNDGNRVSRFVGNSNTHKQDALLMSQFRAIEKCYEDGFLYSETIGHMDNSTSKTVQNTTNFQKSDPTYFGASYVGQGNYVGVIDKGNKYNFSSTWNNTYTFPVMDTYFNCGNKRKVMGLILENIESNIIRNITKDNLGGVQIVGFLEGIPNNDIVEKGDILIKLDDRRVTEFNDVINLIKNSDDLIKAKIIRQEKTMEISLGVYDITERFYSENSKLITKACNSIPEVKERTICKNRNKHKIAKNKERALTQEEFNNNLKNKLQKGETYTEMLCRTDDSYKKDRELCGEENLRKLRVSNKGRK